MVVRKLGVLSCLLVLVHVDAISIKNFRSINASELNRFLGPNLEKVLGPILHGARRREKSEEASEQVDFPVPQVYRDENKNIFFDVWAMRGNENRLMGDPNGQLCVAIQTSPEITDAFNLELWRFFSNVLQVRRDDVEIVLSETNDMARRVLIKGRALSEREVQQRLHANMKSFSLDVLEEAGVKEAAKMDTLSFHTEIRSEFPAGPAPELSQEDVLPRWGPNYIKNPAMLDQVLRDLMPNQEIIIRGRLMKKEHPNFIARPLLENYQGQKSLKVKRKILEGVHKKDKERRKSLPSVPRLSCPGRINGLSVIDTLSEDGARVVSRKVFSPVFQNATHDFVEEIDYTEVEYKAAMR